MDHSVCHSTEVDVGAFELRREKSLDAFLRYKIGHCDIWPQGQAGLLAAEAGPLHYIRDDPL